MAIRMKFRANVNAWKDTAMKIGLVGPDVAEVTFDGYTKRAATDFEVDDGDTEAFTFGDIEAVKGFKLEADNDFTLRINGGDPLVIPSMTLADGTKVVLLLLPVDLTALSVEAHAGAVTGRITFWGDPVEA